MSSRMDKYDCETPELKKRTERNASLYQESDVDNYGKFDLDSNVSVLKTDVRTIDVDQIRDILDKKYRDNLPKRKSISIDTNEDIETIEKEDTKEYDINSILSKAKNNKEVDYDYERLNKIDENNLAILNSVKSNSLYEEKPDEEELMGLINTITSLELKNRQNNAADLLNLAGEDQTETLKPLAQVQEPVSEDTFYTGELTVQDKDFEDFKEIQEDIKSNSILIKILIFIIVIAIIAAAIYFINKYFNLGLF